MSGFALFGYFLVKQNRKLLRRKWYTFFTAVFLIWYVDCLPAQLFQDSTSTVILDRNGQLLGAHIAEDEQWRFPECKYVPQKFKTCIIQFEDRNFYSHFGVSPTGVTRAIWQNMSSGSRVSGGSTITMQLVRLMRKNPSRTYSEKMYEMVLATRIEAGYSKEEILKLYASHAPFGNNVVGIDAAAWRFFGRPANKLSWAESATLAVLPNAPGLIYPGKNHDLLRKKRNRLLKRLRTIGELTESEYRLSLLERLPEKPHPLPSIAPHLLQKCILEGKKGKVVKTTLDESLQQQSLFLLENHAQLLRENGIFNGSIMISDVRTGKVLVYIGNVSEAGREHANQVNCIDAERSTGSILKPLLYGKALESGTITPRMLLRDVPTQFGSFTPKNFAGSFEGLVAADEALSRSLNVPMIHLLQQYGSPKFYRNLNDFGLKSINKGATHYGLSLILGGAEVNMFELNACYLHMAQELQEGTTKELVLYENQRQEAGHFRMDRGAIYSTFQAMLDVRRPDEDNNWHLFDSSKKIAWKTGTSYGFRDAWAVGVTPDYVVSIWVGNADGEGRPGLTGVQAAAPLLFDIFQMLPGHSWFKRPKDKMTQIEVCAVSGHRPSSYCDKQRTEWVPKGALNTTVCPYHQRIHLNAKGERVNSSCASPMEMSHKNWFIVAPEVEEYYKTAHPLYRALPAFDPHCNVLSETGGLAILYPQRSQKIYLPIGFDQMRQSAVFEASHTNKNTVLFWHLDDQFIGQTTAIHQMIVQPEIGKHLLSIYDADGTKKSMKFEIVGSRKAAN